MQAAIFAETALRGNTELLYVDPGRARELGDAHRLGDAAAARDIRLHEVDVGPVDELAEAPPRRVLLARGDAYVDRVGQLGCGFGVCLRAFNIYR